MTNNKHDWEMLFAEKKFISLEEFLLLPDNFIDNREYYKLLMPMYWVEWYYIAKESFLKYGPEGPPVGSKVEMLVSGHGGYGRDWERKTRREGETRTFGGIDPEDDRMFFIQRKDGLSLVERELWWRAFRVLGETQ